VRKVSLCHATFFVAMGRHRGRGRKCNNDANALFLYLISLSSRRCKSLQVATKQLTVHEPPKALVVHLKRFGPLGGKINSMISYDKTFDISPYMSQGQVSPSPLLFPSQSFPLHRLIRPFPRSSLPCSLM
jgi:hypothetical protein